MLLKVFRCFRLMRLLRLARFARVWDRWHTSFGFSYCFLALAQLIGGGLLVCHWCACLWGGLALQGEHHGEATWLSALQAAKGGSDESYHSAARVYCLSVYWAVVTLTSIGYGDITPQNDREYWVATICMIVMACNWAYVVGSVCGILSALDPDTVYFKNALDRLNTLMMKRHIPQTMRRTLRAYFYESRSVRGMLAEQDIVQHLSPMLQGEIAVFMYKSRLGSISYLANLDPDEVVALAVHIGAMVFAPSEKITILRMVFVISRGIAARKGRVLTVGESWGEDMILNDSSMIDRNWTQTFGHIEV
eukprot:gnl/TRDRNA2_/TRDRNA2_163313_c1_seq4.p1 gnl/TRDRNA2_/TRDRNA2_163313_c1~~gnl/TRDRNA2_/TRDRNA2_163313_c1_seq4.p1  ORF type:complete len:347 (-),score=41.01 gnl/TRDRNA2_/TRDRNA2_163313_c1_seq4:28-945(-)